MGQPLMEANISCRQAIKKRQWRSARLPHRRIHQEAIPLYLRHFMRDIVANDTSDRARRRAGASRPAHFI